MPKEEIKALREMVEKLQKEVNFLKNFITLSDHEQEQIKNKRNSKRRYIEEGAPELINKNNEYLTLKELSFIFNKPRYSIYFLTKKAKIEKYPLGTGQTKAVLKKDILRIITQPTDDNIELHMYLIKSRLAMFLSDEMLKILNDTKKAGF